MIERTLDYVVVLVGSWNQPEHPSLVERIGNVVEADPGILCSSNRYCSGSATHRVT